MKRIFFTLVLILFCSLSANCFLNPLSQFVTESIFPTKENCPNCTEQQFAALAAVIKPNANGIKAFAFDLSSSFSNYCGSGICAGGITEAQPNSTVTVAVPFGTDVSSLKATFSIAEKSKLEVGGILQVSGITAQNFTNPVVYQYTDENGVSQNYSVTVKPALSGDQVNGTVLVSGMYLWTKCSYGQLWRPGFNDCQGKGNESDNYGANLGVAFCDTDDGACDPYGKAEFQNACYEMQTALSPPNIPSNVMRPGSFNDLNLLTSCPSYSKGPMCGTGDQCPGNTGSTINATLFPQTVNGYYWTFSPGGCSAATLQVIQFGGTSNTTTHTKSSKGKAIRCMYNIFS
ncbi:glycoside hydrolase xylanase [Leptospira adleri]|uniref:Glycoside hydrolase xylanase n=1 Tax=Leptospira adleri TaxID=2023186 RepID=A0A2M9YIP6_9LEPT|nr:glycoside hydrolase xylanase [Leptospira adleri]PJZ51411.1 glycoside hydrolase xylanase [Leptospira adleri]PJZ63298.1 glycoside hydrolase xylanase [Leptospira adleri]